VRDAVEIVGLAGVASRLPQGLETMLSTTRRDDEEVAGISLSGGQWQRVALARAAVRAPVDVLVMDEPDTALDSDGTAVVSRIAAAGSASKVVILVTHSPDTARQADHVIELGSAVRTGCGVVVLG
jgi:ATP-binding cassette subfamily B protein